MGYNSDGYIMFDFSDVDFTRTNQTIDGIYDRIAKVDAVNKFVLLINANGKTPLPSAVSITNGQYVIESGSYTFSIASNDNLHITKHSDVDDLIDDDHTSTSTTYSSTKIINVVNGLIDDAHTDNNKTWSSSRIMEVLGLNLSPLQFIEKTATINIGGLGTIWVDDDITADMWVLPFTSEYGLVPANVSCSDGSCSFSLSEPLDHSIVVGVRLYKPLTSGV